MADCELLAKCPFFNDKMQEMPAMADLIKTRYCRADHESCARKVVRRALGADRVPGFLFPNQLAAAHEIIAAAEPKLTMAS